MHLHATVQTAHHTLDAVLVRTRFWRWFAGTSMNERQTKLINRLLDGFEGKLTSGKLSAMLPDECHPEE